jgi:putative tryptophan/tyrosine transport system substrate-binding protein
MRRRAFLALLGGAAWSLSASAQRAGKAPRVGTLGLSAIPDREAEGLHRGIAQFFPGKVLVENRDVAGRPELFGERAAELVRLKVDVLFARGAPALLAAKAATASIPIVAVDLESDPVAMGFVKTLARPGGNITGVFMDLPELSGKQMELLKEVFANIARVAILGDPEINAPQFAATEAAARAFAVQSDRIGVRIAADFENALKAAVAKHDEAVILLSSPPVFAQVRRIAELAVTHRLPAISLFPEFPRAGGFMAYGPSLPEAFRRCGGYVGRILQGAKPADLPIERPERFEFVINAKTAKALDRSVPPALLGRADEVIE